MKTLYVGTFDPLHMGHCHVINNSPGDLTVGLAQNADKKTLLSYDMRWNLLQNATEQLDGLMGFKVTAAQMPSDKYVAVWAIDNNIECIIRGIRNNTDLEYEKVLAKTYREIGYYAKFLYVIPPPELTHISSSLIKSLLGYKGEFDMISKYVDLDTLRAIKERVCLPESMQ